MSPDPEFWEPSLGRKCYPQKAVFMKSLVSGRVVGPRAGRGGRVGGLSWKAEEGSEWTLGRACTAPCSSSPGWRGALSDSWPQKAVPLRTDTSQWPSKPRGRVSPRGSAHKPSHPNRLQSNTFAGLMVPLLGMLLRPWVQTPPGALHAPQPWRWWSGASPVTGTQPSLVGLQTSVCGVKLYLAGTSGAEEGGELWASAPRAFVCQAQHCVQSAELGPLPSFPHLILPITLRSQ